MIEQQIEFVEEYAERRFLFAFKIDRAVLYFMGGIIAGKAANSWSQNSV